MPWQAHAICEPIYKICDHDHVITKHVLLEMSYQISDMLV